MNANDNAPSSSRRIVSRPETPSETAHPSTSISSSGRRTSVHSRPPRAGWDEESAMLMCLLGHDHADAPGVQVIDVLSAALEHSALIDVALVSDFAGVDRRRMLEYQQSRWR